MTDQDADFSDPRQEDKDLDWFNLPDEPDEGGATYFDESLDQEGASSEPEIEEEPQLSTGIDRVAAEEIDRWREAFRANSNGQQERRPERHKRQPTAMRRKKHEQELAPSAIAVEDHPENVDEMLAEYELMEALAKAASAAHNRSEASYLVAAMVPLAAQLASRYRYQLQPVLPVLIQGAAGVAEVMHDEARARPLIRLAPTILVHTVRHLAQYVAQGRSITRQVAADVLAEYTGEIIGRYHRANNR